MRRRMVPGGVLMRSLILLRLLYLCAILLCVVVVAVRGQ
jgi:hypothetical protein